MENKEKKTQLEIGRAVSAYLKANRISHMEAAERLGLRNKQQVSNHTCGRRRFSRMMAARYAAVFGFSTEFLLRGKGDLFASECDVPTIRIPADRYAELQDTVRSLRRTVERLSELLGPDCIPEEKNN